MIKCVHHPGRNGMKEVNSKSYCSSCIEGQTAAEKLVRRHVRPRDCFVCYKGNKEGWKPITGTGCAHFVAHDKNIKRGSPLCLQGYTVRVRDLVFGRQRIVDLANVQVGDIWANKELLHCGIVRSIIPCVGKAPRIEIEHASSRLEAVSRNDFNTHFHGQGSFYR